MNIKGQFALMVGKLSVFFLKAFHKSGTALPGYLAMKIDNSFLDIINKKCDKIILITGTNGKTTTNNLINHLLKDNVILSNLKGANMKQGIATTYIRNTKDYYDYGIFEVDEGSLDHVSKYIKADYLIITNFFRDQLDRYGEIEGIINEVLDDMKLLPNTKLILNCDDPYVNQFTIKTGNEVVHFGLNVPSNKILEENLTLKKCPICAGKLEYSEHTYGHLGNYTCLSCGFNNKEKNIVVSDVEENNTYQKITIEKNHTKYNINYPYLGLYNAYNLCAAFTLSNELGLDVNKVIESAENFSFSLGRMEEFQYKNKLIKVILTKNPIGLSQITRIISDDKRKKTVVHILNDNIADGRDISWIWDANTLCLNDDTIKNYYCSGIRAEDIALKKKYDDVDTRKIHIIEDMKKVINTAIEDDVEIVYVLPTYTAIFETRDYVNSIVNK